MVTDLTSTHEGHLGCHDRHELHVGIQRQASHVCNSACNVLNIHSWFSLDRPVCLKNAARHSVGQLCSGIADVDLTASNVVLAAVKRSRLGKPSYRVLGGRIGSRVRPRSVGRNGTVVDYSPPRGT